MCIGLSILMAGRTALVACALVGAFDAGPTAGEDPAAVARRRLAGMSRAYQLDDQQKVWFRAELDRRVAEAGKHSAELAAATQRLREATGRGGSSGKFEEARQAYQKCVRRDPLGQENLIEFLDQHVRPEQKAVGSGRIRAKNAAVKETEEKQYNDKVAEQVRESQVMRRSMIAAPITAPSEPLSQRPLLGGKVLAENATKGAAQATGPQSGSAQGGTELGQARSASHGPSKQPTNQHAAGNRPSDGGTVRLSEWGRIVADAASRYHFTGPQRATAEAILKDLQHRADAYHAVHAGEEQHLAGIKDARERSTAQKSLNAPLAAMEQELRERIDQIPTAEQRAAVNPPVRPLGK